MTQVDVTARAQKNLVLQIGDPVSGDSYEKHVSSIDWTPKSEAIEWRGGTPDAVLTDQSTSTWTANVTAVQDWQNPDSLVNFLLAHEGEQVAARYKPDADGDFEITANITLVAPMIGGPVNAFNESTVAMGSDRPVVTTPETP